MKNIMSMLNTFKYNLYCIQFQESHTQLFKPEPCILRTSAITRFTYSFTLVQVFIN